MKLYSTLPTLWLETPFTLHAHYPSVCCTALHFTLDGKYGAEVCESSTEVLLGMDESHADSAGDSW